MSHSFNATNKGFATKRARRKRLGQYFSGQPVSRLLAALATSKSIRSVVDPMAGRGDLLIAANNLIPNIERLDGIEIDPIAYHECQQVLASTMRSKASCFLGSAFDPKILAGLDTEGYDLVITNPPYVRYQAQKNSVGQIPGLPSALEVRNGLRQCIDVLKTLSDEDKRNFGSLITGYSGLSDLAVPSWLLCGALVKPGGTLAMVVPDTWLNRDYASVVQYTLLRWFRIEFVVEDQHAAWFPDALVKTTLLVAKRVARKHSIGDWKDEAYLHIAIPSTLANQDSLFGRSELGKKSQPEVVFAKAAWAVLKGNADSIMEGVFWQRVPLADKARSVVTLSARETWINTLEPSMITDDLPTAVIPSSFANWFDGFRQFCTLKELGVTVGQGLRTGANDFFYADCEASSKEGTVLQLSKLFECKYLLVPNDSVRPVIRKQSDLDEFLLIKPEILRGRVFALQKYALPEDAREAKCKPMPEALAAHVHVASTTPVGDEHDAKLIPSLSAVATNVRKADPTKGTPARFWYMLPDFALRHRPDLLLARVNSASPRVFLNPKRTSLVDANFSTLWLDEESNISVHAVCAMLNSSLAKALYEMTATVMGGGALKLEATHIRALPIPKISASAWVHLDALGQALVKSAEKDEATIMSQIDKTICSEIFGARKSADKLADLYKTIKQRRSARLRKK